MKTNKKPCKLKRYALLLFLNVLFLVGFELWFKQLYAGSQQNTIVRFIEQGSDDAGLHPNDYFSTGLNEIYFGECYNGQEIVSGFRFQDIQISKSDEIENAHIEFTVDGTYSNEIWIKFHGEAVDSSHTFSDSDKPSDRPLTTQFVEWRLTAEDVWQWNTKHQSPDLTTILQEIVSRSGWTPGNAVSIIVKNVASSQNHRRIYAIEREGSASAAKLIINAPSPPQYELYQMYPRIWAINFDPIIPSQNNNRLHQVFNWNDPEELNIGYRSDIESISHGLVKNQIVKTIDVDFFPLQVDGFQYTNKDANTPGSFLYAHANNDWHLSDGVDYKAIIRDYDLARKLDFGEVDEIWLHGGPYFGYYESRMAGRGGYWCNSPASARIAASKIFILMGFNYERGVAEMLHDLGHRAESIMSYVYGSWSADSTHAWNRFTLYDQIWPGGASCGNVHFPPNGTSDYDYGNMTYVWSTHRDWLENYPNLTGQKEWANATEWGNGDMREYHKWWFLRFPHVEGSTTEYGMTRSNNWWHYVVDFNNYPESGGGRATGFCTAPSYSSATYCQLTTNLLDDWAPKINTNGRVVWYGFDGNDYEIYSAYSNGLDFVQVTDNLIDDENPKINENDQIVWQAFDGADFEIFTANAHGTNIVQITDNQTNDWHPAISNSDRLVWDGWDGADYEIFSCNIDGSNWHQITNNQAASAYPSEDVWPQINDNGRVVWMGYNGGDWDIYSANFDGTDMLQISETDFDDEYPMINNANQVVWHTYHNDINVEIHAALADGESNDIVISNNLFEDWYPRINNASRIVWMAHNGWNWDIYSANFDGSDLTRITNGPTDHQYPDIDDTGFIVWQGYDGNDWEIFGFTNNTIYQLSDNEVNDRSPMVSNNNAVWHSNSRDSSSSDIHSFIINPPVPVELAAFNADVNENIVILHWATATENNNFGFEIERSLDNLNFEKIGLIPGNNTTNTPHNYKFSDYDLKTGSYYYRLKQIDNDGSFKYSNVIEVGVGVPKIYKLGQNFPNPFNPETTINYQIPEAALVKLEIFNMLGQRVRTLVEVQQPAGYYRARWDGKDGQQIRVSTGMYFYVLKTNHFRTIKKLLLIQ